MNRNFFCDVIILSSRIFGEDNRIFTVLSHEYGVFDAVLYGGRKSKLRSMCSPYHCGKMWFYRDEKQFGKGSTTALVLGKCATIFSSMAIFLAGLAVAKFFGVV